MKIGDNAGSSSKQVNIKAAQRVIEEFEDVASKLRGADNISDSIDLNTKQGIVEVKFSDLGKNTPEKYTGTVTYDPASGKGFTDLLVTKNYDKYGGVGTNYAFHNRDENTIYYRRDEMYQEYPMCRFIEEVEEDKKSGQIKSYNAWEERDDSFTLFDDSDIGEYNIHENK